MQRARKQLMIAILCLTSCLCWASVGYSILGVADIVFDPTNYGVNMANQVNILKTTLLEAEQVANQVRGLENQLASLRNEATNLRANPLRLLGQIEGLWSSYNGLMQNAEGIAFGLQQAQSRFEQTYPGLANADIHDITRQTGVMLTSIRASSQTAVSTQSIYERLCAQLDNNRQALTSAQASAGALEAAQAQAQLQALSNEQQATLTQITAASSRVQTEWIAMQAKERSDAEAAHEAFVSDYGRQGFKGIGQSTAIDLR